MSKRSEEEKRNVPIESEEPVKEKLEQESVESDISGLEQEIAELKKSVEETQNSYLRVLADFDNFRKRQREETARLTNCAREDIIRQLLPIIDNFDRALQAAEGEHSYDSLVEGVTLPLKKVREMLQKEGLEPIEAVGQEFNPEFHEALMRVETDEYPENTIIDELEKGYTLNGKVVRPARVRVAASE